jgi:hypothetical protein
MKDVAEWGEIVSILADELFFSHLSKEDLEKDDIRKTEKN